MCCSSSQGFIVYRFPYGCFDQVTSGKKDATGIFNYNCLIAHNWQISASRDAASHYRGNLGNAHTAHDGIISEYPSKMFLIREDLILHWQVYSRTIYQVNYGQPVFNGNLLGSQVLLCSNGKPGTCLHGSIICYYDALFS